jgi:NADPH-dependent 2,4-dienoyl-CoA reductase/sulfur reductase-like enzyme/peroxiredoxin family protein/TusA-related sulfurtransferase/rhodanese-related sulfurtransferase
MITDMEKKKYAKTVIIGGVAGGATAAARLRRMDEHMEIVILERGEYISYANCGLPYYIGDTIKERENLLLQTPGLMKRRFNIEVRVQNEVTAIHKEEKTVEVKNLKTGESYEESYDALIIATGSSPLKPPIPGIDGANIFTLWTVPDTDRIKEYIDVNKPKNAAVIGGGFIGLEMAENLHAAGLKVSIIEMQNQVMAPMDYEMAQLLHGNLELNGVELILGDGVSSFENKGDETTIHLTSGKAVEADMVILSIGIRPNSALAKEAGLSLNARGGVITDEYMRTSEPDIYAVGDVIETENYTLKERTMVPLAGPANKQARVLADVMTGTDRTYKGVQATSVAKVFDLTAAAVGVNEKTLIGKGLKKEKDYYSILVDQKSHAGYYPGAVMLTMKLLFDKEGKILGAQIIGEDGADKRIDVLATVMRLNGTVYDLAELELAYAPPYSSAKDPVNMLGFVAQNVLEGRVSFISYDETDRMLAEEMDGFTVLDVTEAVEREVFSISESYHIPLGQLRERMEELSKDKLIIVYCAIGVRAYNGARILMQNGFSNVKVLSGGMTFYKSMHYKDRNESAGGGGQQELKAAQESGDAPGTEDIIGKVIKNVDCCGMQCPGPIMKVNEALCEMKPGEILKVCATDMGFVKDVESWCRRTGNTFLKSEPKESKTLKEKGNVVFIRKGAGECRIKENALAGSAAQGKTMVVFSGDLDKVLASFIIANGAAAMGRPVTMFFTFWGLNALRKPEKQSVKKSFIEKMFGAMMPRGVKKLTLSRMNMAGMGTAMMKKVMADKNVDSLEELMKQAMANGVKLVACTMSMDVMGITKEELIDGVELAGVASYLGDAEESNVNLFI